VLELLQLPDSLTDIGSGITVELTSAESVFTSVLAARVGSSVCVVGTTGGTGHISVICARDSKVVAVLNQPPPGPPGYNVKSMSLLPTTATPAEAGSTGNGASSKPPVIIKFVLAADQQDVDVWLAALAEPEDANDTLALSDVLRQVYRKAHTKSSSPPFW
jgi:hypothetical protein